MQVTGANRISATPQMVWDALFDPAVLRQCIPGCEEVRQISPTEFTAAVVLKIGPVKAKFAGKVTLSNLVPPRACQMTGEGSGGAAGFAKGVAAVKIEPDGTETIVSYTADAQIGGKLAQLGSRMIESTTKKLADEFFSNFAKIVGGDDQASTSADGTEALGTQTATTAAVTLTGRNGALLVFGLVCAALVAAYVLLAR